MSIEIDLSPELERELREAAGRSGVTPADRASLDVYLARSLATGGAEISFSAGARSILRKNDVDPDRLASALRQIEATSAPPRSDSAPTTRVYTPQERAELQALARRIREEALARPTEAVGLSDDDPVRERRRVAPSSLRGKYAFVPFSSEDHAREKQLELGHEEGR